MPDNFYEKLSQAALQTITYSDIFDYPLTAHEIHRYLTGVKASYAKVLKVLEEEPVARVGEYFTVPGRESIAGIRMRREASSRKIMPRAIRYGRILAALPYIRMVTLTGSLAMSNMEEGQDIDYMIVTAPNHLWTCRALALLVARFARFEGIQLCPNFLITENALTLTDRSLYAAHEMTQMILISGSETYGRMRRLNAWTDEYLPNAQGAPTVFDMPKTPVHFQKLFEFLFRLLPSHLFEQWEMNRKIQKLSCEQASSSESYFSKDVCKGHADRHAEKTDRELKIRLRSFESSFALYTADVDVS
ncbi:MAG TPA: hypothetical protein VN653_05135 [Anaerolineales bacterium]|nr:hypothetical protein [Anaerolineales bacterium]